MRLKCEYGLVTAGLVLVIVTKCPVDSISRLVLIGVAVALFGFIYCIERKWKRSNNSCNGKRFEPVWKNFRDAQRIQFFGLWCTCILPIIILMSRGLTTEFWILTFLQIPIFGFTLSTTIALRSESNYLFAVGPTILTATAIVGLFIYLRLGWCWIVLVPLPLLYVVAIVPARVIIYFSRCFTYGEFVVIWQAVLFSLANAISTMYSEITVGDQADQMTPFLSLSLICLAAFLIVSFYNNKFWTNLFVILAAQITISYVILQRDFISYLVQLLVLSNKQRLIVLLFWALCVACTLHFVAIVRIEQKLTTVHRKFFHLTVSLVLFSGLLYDPEITYLASILALFGFIVVELIRYLNVPPFGDSLNKSLQMFLDDQDQGSLILTHIYLLVATFLPLWLDPCRNLNDVRFVHFAGFISIGVGDSFASIGGSLIGKRKFFHDSGKTIEGTLCSFVAEILASQIVIYLISGKITLLSPYLVVCCFLVSLMEAITCQIDNLILPLYSFILFYYV